MELPLIVRVKRRRSQSPSSTICIVQDDEQQDNKKHGVAKSIDNIGAISLTTNVNIESKTSSRQWIMLKRAQTVESSFKGSILNLHSSYVPPDETSSAQSTNKRSILFVPKKRTTMKSIEDRQYLVLDMNQITMGAQSSSIFPDGKASLSSSSVATNSSIPTPSRQRILDPVTRQLDGAIQIANRSGDFAGVALAISTGANINHRTRDVHGGLTALIVATSHCNLRMVKRLLAQDADVFLTNIAGETALDVARSVIVSSDRLALKMEIQQWLHRAALKQHARREGRHAFPKQTANTDIEGTNSAMTETEGDGDYVYDIFQTEPLAATGTYEAESYSGPVVPVEGLQFTAGGGVISDPELVFDYDSDWSALAAGDGEDSDSNDENHRANDYPEDEEDERDDDDEDSVEDENENVGFRHRDHKRGDLGADIDYGSDYDNDDGFPGFAGNSVGRVMRPHVVGQGKVFRGGRDTSSIQQVWGEGSDDEADDGRNTGLSTRLKDMHRRTGMEFASDPR